MLSLHLFSLSIMRFLQGLSFTKAAILYGFMIPGLFHASSKKGLDSRNRMGGSVRSTFQKVQRGHQLECSYASFMLSLRYYLCLFYTNYDSTKKQCYVVSCSSVYFLPPQRRGTIRAIRWEVRPGQYFRRSREFMSLNFRILLLCYHYSDLRNVVVPMCPNCHLSLASTCSSTSFVSPFIVVVPCVQALPLQLSL